MSWNDPRLQYNDGPPTVVTPVELVWKYLWIPDVFVANARETFRHETLRTDAGVSLKPNGDLITSVKYVFPLVGTSRVASYEPF